MKLSERVQILSDLGELFNRVCLEEKTSEFPGFNNIRVNNPWFTEQNVRFALTEWSDLLKKQNINNWVDAYNIPVNGLENIKLGIISAGNIPLVGLHDLICGFICGAKIRIKLSSKDNILFKWVINTINNEITTELDKILISDQKLEDFNAVIATGNNNTNRYFEYYFGSYPKILRHNRNSIAILTGTETNDDLELIADDVFRYFGLGCRNVSSFFVPMDYDFNDMGKAFQKYADLIDNHKYANNFNYQYTMLAMNRTIHINFGNCLLVEKEALHSPISVLNYRSYENLDAISNFIAMHKNEIQCIVCKDTKIKNSILPGQTQKPSLTDYADNIDTIKFLLNLQYDN
ncbi:MAG: hypothetical protein JXR36_13225 [Bacteroidales bacterium]|nr:hypothetical protein [Bacteroidales bacterium]